MRKRIAWWVGIVVVAVSSPDAFADDTLFAFGGAESSILPEASPHGIVSVGWQRTGLPSDARLQLVYNTDTVEFRYDGVRLSEPGENSEFRVGTRIKAQFLIARLLTEYYRRGELVGERGFGASYLHGDVHLEGALGGKHHFVDTSLGVRRWFFQRLEQTSDSFLLPAETTVFRQRISYTYWDFAPDRSQWEWHRPTMRLRGFGMGARVGVDRRREARPWGTVEGRNEPEHTIFHARQWAGLGIRIAEPLRLQLYEQAGWSDGDDDLARPLVGGMNPWVVEVAGVPWAGFLASRFVAGSASIHFTVLGETEVGLRGDVAYLSDPHRAADFDRFGVVSGVGAFVDYRNGPWQADVELGYALPAKWQADRPHTSALVLVGRRIDL